MEAEQENKTKKKRVRIGFGAAWITFISIALALGLGFFAWLQVKNYGDNVIDIYADQQDAYVQLVLDQINLVENRSNEEIIKNILGTIDGTKNEYWTLSRNDSLVYVKDVAESNRYRGFSTQTYFDTSSAKEFISKLEPDVVRHAIITMDDRKFIASGVVFEYNGSTYRMCLLTSEHMVVDSNAYLTARVNLGIAIAACLLAMVLIALSVALRGDKWKRKAYQDEAESESLRRMVERLNEYIAQNTPVDTRGTIYDEKAAKVLFEKIEERGEFPTTFFAFDFDSPDEEQAFLQESIEVFGKRVLKFRLGTVLVLAFIGTAPAEVQSALACQIETPVVVSSIFVMKEDSDEDWERARTVLLKGKREAEGNQAV